MTLWSKSSFLAVFVLAALPAAHAQSPGSREALQCLLDIGPDHCGKIFVAGATGPARPWIYPNQGLRFSIGAVQSVSYAGSILDGHQQSVSGKPLNWKRWDLSYPADIFDVKFTHQEMTFFISPPDADGKVRHMMIHGGAPDDYSAR